MAPTETLSPETTNARKLWDEFYSVVESSLPAESIQNRPATFPVFKNAKGKMYLPTQADPREMEDHRNSLIPKKFRFSWLLLPKGARYV